MNTLRKYAQLLLKLSLGFSLLGWMVLASSVNFSSLKLSPTVQTLSARIKGDTLKPLAQSGPETQVELLARLAPPTSRAARPDQVGEHRQAPLLTPQTGGDEFEEVEERLKWFLFERTYPFDSLPPQARQQAFEAAAALSAPTTEAAATATTWNPIGPAPTNAFLLNNWGVTSGRINAIAPSPANPQLVLIGGGTGGIWRSTDGGVTFVPVSDNQVDLAVQSIVFAPSNPQIVYAGMGDLGGYLGSGVLKSTDAGQTWTRVSNATLPTPGMTAKIAVDPTNPDRVYLAQFTTQNTSTNTRFASGFFLSTDGGVNWTRTLQGLARDLAIHPANPQTLYLAMTRVDSSTADLPAGIYRSTDGGSTWTNIFTSPYDPTRDVRVGVTAADPQRIYGYLGGTLSGSLDIRVVVSTDGGATWTNRGGAGVDRGQFGYNTYLAVDPASANTLYVGSRDVYKSTDGGVSWVNLNNAFTLSDSYTPQLSNAHPDQQSFGFLPGNSNTFFIGNDGGLYRTTDGGSTFQSLNNSLSLTMFVGYALHPTNPAVSYGGTQDNGSQRRLSTPPGRWSEFTAGDGGNCVIDPLNPSTVFSTYIYGSITRFQNDGQMYDAEVGNNAIFGEPTTGARIAFYPPFTGNGVNSTLYFGTWRLFISTDRGATWSAPAGTLDLTKGDSDVLRAIGVSRSNTNVIYTGSREGRAMVSTNGGSTWTDITTGLPNRAITSITVDATNAATAYLTVSGYASSHVFKTTTTGATWTDINGDLPNIPVQSLLIDPSSATTLYAGTDIGIFRSTVGGTTWTSFNTGLPPVIINKLVTNASGVIQAATYGRGAYELPAASATSCPSVTGLNPTSGAVGATVTITGTNFTGVTGVKFSTNVTATFTVVNDTTITATVPSGAATGPITISKTGCGDAPTASFTITCPTITLSPSTLPDGVGGTAYNQTVSASPAGSYTFAVTAGALPAALSLNSATGAITGTPTTAGAANFTITATGAGPCSGSQAYTLNINPVQNTPRIVRAVSASASPGGSVSIPIELDAQGNENALGFSLTFDPAALSSPQAALGADASAATLNFNSTQAAQGRIGILLSLPAGQSFAAGTRRIVTITLAVAAGAAGTATPLAFADQPVARELGDLNANILPATFTPGTVTVSAAQGYEADVAPRPNGSNNGTITAVDWVQLGRFAAGLDTAANGSEFQRADCAPRETLGDGRITIADWVQAGRYAAGLDAVTAAGGPTAPVPAAQAASTAARGPGAPEAAIRRGWRAVKSHCEPGQDCTLTIELEARGGENAAGFSLRFDPSQLRFQAASAGYGAVINVNTSQITRGSLGLALALPAGQTLPGGTLQLVTLTFTRLDANEARAIALGFADQPVARELIDVNARTLPASYAVGDGLINLRAGADVSAASFSGAELASEAITFGTDRRHHGSLPNATVNIGGSQAQVDYAGPPNDFLGLDQINVRVPRTLIGRDAVDVALMADGQAANLPFVDGAT